MSDEIIKHPASSNNGFTSALNNFNIKLQVKLDGYCLKRHKVPFTQKQVVNIYITCEMYLWSYIQSAADFTLGNSLFGAVKLMHADNFRYLMVVRLV